MANAVKWGILSTADINRKLIPGAHACRRSISSRSRAATRHALTSTRATSEIERAYGSYEALLADPEIEAVYIPLPNTMHCDWSIRALEAGKHVLCEKPLSRHPDDVRRRLRRRGAFERFLMEAFMYRHNPQTKRLTELVADGAIGELRLIRSTFPTRSTTRTTSGCAPRWKAAL